MLAVGGDLKNAPAFAKKRDVYLSPYIGDLEDPITRRDFGRQVRKIMDLYGIEPEVVLHDLHPGYATREWALSLDHVRTIGVQHHHAHIVAGMAEHGLDEVLGLAFDGTGFGLDGKIWGGEFLMTTRDGFHRVASFAEFSLPGGEASIRHPIRIALAILSDTPEGIAGIEDVFSRQVDPTEMDLLSRMIARELNAPKTTSLGRVFDAAAALLGLVDTVSYEGEGPIRLEGAAWQAFRQGNGPSGKELVPLDSGDPRLLRLEAAPLLRKMAEQSEHESVDHLALLFHEAIADGVRRACLKLRADTGQGTLALSGGVFQNLLLRTLLIPALKAEGFSVFVNNRIPPGDGGLAVGQVYYRAGGGSAGRNFGVPSLTVGL